MAIIGKILQRYPQLASSSASSSGSTSTSTVLSAHQRSSSSYRCSTSHHPTTSRSLSHSSTSKSVHPGPRSTSSPPHRQAQTRQFLVMSPDPRDILISPPSKRLSTTSQRIVLPEGQAYVPPQAEMSGTQPLSRAYVEYSGRREQQAETGGTQPSSQMSHRGRAHIPQSQLSQPAAAKSSSQFQAEMSGSKPLSHATSRDRGGQFSESEKRGTPPLSQTSCRERTQVPEPSAWRSSTAASTSSPLSEIAAESQLSDPTHLRSIVLVP